MIYPHKGWLKSTGWDRSGEILLKQTNQHQLLPNTSKNITFKLLQSSSTHNFILHLESRATHVITASIMARASRSVIRDTLLNKYPSLLQLHELLRASNYCLSLSTLQWVKKDAVPLSRSYSIAHGATTANVTSMT